MLGISAPLVLIFDAVRGVPVAFLDCLLLATLPLRLPARAFTLKSGGDVSVCTPAACPLLGEGVDEADFEFEEDRTGMAGTSWFSGSAICGAEFVSNLEFKPFPGSHSDFKACLLEGGFTAEDGAVSAVFGLVIDAVVGTIFLTSALLMAESNKSVIKDLAYRKSRKTQMPADASWGYLYWGCLSVGDPLWVLAQSRCSFGASLEPSRGHDEPIAVE